jgi:hypothetical protein
MVTVPHFSLGSRLAPWASGGQAPQVIEVWALVWTAPAWTAPAAVLAVGAVQAVTAAAARAPALMRRA